MVFDKTFVGVQVLIRYGEQHLQNVAQKPKI
jgi:hypothetical protein